MHVMARGLSIYIHRITSVKRTHEVRPLLLVREGNPLLVRYTCKILYIFTEFQVSERLHRGFLHDYLIGYIIIT